MTEHNDDGGGEYLDPLGVDTHGLATELADIISREITPLTADDARSMTSLLLGALREACRSAREHALISVISSLVGADTDEHPVSEGVTKLRSGNIIRRSDGTYTIRRG
jgi:hypothetical protein